MSKICLSCGAVLSSKNTGTLCFPCQRKKQDELEHKLQDNPHYTLEDMCFILGLKNKESVKKLNRDGKIPGRVPGVRKHLYQKQVINEWIHNAGGPPNEKVLQHFQKLSVALLTVATNFETYLKDIGPAIESIGDFVYGGDEYGEDIRYGMGMRKVDQSAALNVLYHLKGEFPELSEVKDWGDLTPGGTINDDLIIRLQLKAHGGQFSGKCPACPH